MDVVHILVEGETDRAFLKALLARIPEIAFALPTASSAVWRTLRISPQQRTPPHCATLRDGRLLILTVVGGWANVSSYAIPLKAVTIEDGTTVSVSASAFLFDADAPTTSFGEPCNFGGHAARLAKLRELCVKASPQPDIFLFPDNQNDGTLETLLLDLIPEARRRTFIDGCWGAYRDCVKTHGAHYQPTLKHAIGQYAARFEKQAATRNQLYESTFADKSMWNWDSPALDPLKRFLSAFLSPKR